MKKELNYMASKIAKAEGKKSQVKIGDIREILRLMAELMITDMKFIEAFKTYLLFVFIERTPILRGKETIKARK